MGERVFHPRPGAPMAASSPSPAMDRSQGAGRSTSAGSWELADIAIHARDAPPPDASPWTRALLSAPETRSGDAEERAADRAADAALRAETTGAATSCRALRSVGRAPWGDGRPMSRAERAWHEPGAGIGLADIRVHDEPRAGRWADMLGARAFTIGRDVVMGTGAYRPATRDGRHLMAHELAHVAAGRDDKRTLRDGARGNGRGNGKPLPRRSLLKEGAPSRDQDAARMASPLSNPGFIVPASKARPNRRAVGEGEVEEEQVATEA